MIPERRRRCARGIVAALILATWWTAFGPVVLGGPAAFVIVQGRSMEPTYRDGDLVVARTSNLYRVGDAVVFLHPAHSGFVIHRLSAGDAEQGWATRGDGNGRDDPWVLADGRIVGREWFVVPRLGAMLARTQQRPWPLVVIIVSSALLLATTGRGTAEPRSRHPDLEDALRSSVRAPRRAGRPIHELLLLIAAACPGALTLALLMQLATGRSDPTTGGARSLLLLVGTATLGAFAVVTWRLYRRLGDGLGVEEPDASRYALSDLTWCPERLPVPTRFVEHSDLLAFRAYAAATTRRVLWTREAIGSRGVRDTYLTIDREGTGHRWVVMGPVTSGADRPRRARRRPVRSGRRWLAVLSAGLLVLPALQTPSAATTSSTAFVLEVAPLVADTRVVLTVVWESPE